MRIVLYDCTLHDAACSIAMHVDGALCCTKCSDRAPKVVEAAPTSPSVPEPYAMGVVMGMRRAVEMLDNGVPAADIRKLAEDVGDKYGI